MTGTRSKKEVFKPQVCQDNFFTTKAKTGIITMMKTSKIYIAGHTGMVGSSLVRTFKDAGFLNLVLKTRQELDLQKQSEVYEFLLEEKPDYIIIAAARVGGILANDTFRAQFIFENLMIECNLIHGAHLAAIENVLFLGSSCIYPKHCSQPMREEYLLSGMLEPTNEPYAIAKIAGIKLCESYFRQYGHNYYSVMPTNLYGPNDNYNLETSHVLPALLRKFHIAHLLELGDLDGVRQDLKDTPISSDFEMRPELSVSEILNILKQNGIHFEGKDEPKKSIAKNYERSSRVSVRLWGSGEPSREFLHVDDLSKAILFLLQNVDAGSIYRDNVTHINIGTGSDLKIRDLAHLIKGIIGYTGAIEWDKTKPDGMQKKLLDVSNIESRGWKYQIELHTGIVEEYNNYCRKSDNNRD